MPGFVGPGISTSTHMKHGKPNRPKRTSEAGAALDPHPQYPITDDFASCSVPGFSERHAKTNGKSGFNTVPARPPAGRLVQRPGEPNRGAGKVIGHVEGTSTAANEEQPGHHKFAPPEAE